MDVKKLVTVRDSPLPMNFKTLGSFLGLASYNQYFVPNIARITQRIHSLTKKDATFTWIQPASKLKKVLITAPVLCHPDLRKPFVHEKDAHGLD